MISLQTSPSHALFRSKEGHPLKFRLQPGLSNSIKNQLEQTITNHGGAILSKVPIHGIVVIDPKSRSGRELLLEWAWPERPYRFFVSYTYVLACVDAGRLLPLRESALKREAFLFGTPTQTSATRLKELPSDVKEKLAAYLASAVPDSSGNRSSNALYFKLTEDISKYPWAEGYDWKALRTEYCRNKEMYDIKIAELISVGTLKRTETLLLPATSTPRPTRLANTRSLESRMRSTFRPTKKLLISQPRKFAADVTNVDRKHTAGARKYGALKATNVRKRAVTKNLRLQETLPDHEEVEVGRGLTVSENIWTDDQFQRPKSLQSVAASRLMKDFPFDISHNTSVALEDDTDEEGGMKDEHTVEDILGLPTIIERETPCKRNDSKHSTNIVPASSFSFAKDLATETRFTLREVEEKLGGFSGDMGAQMNEAVTSTSGRMMVRASLNY